MDAPPPPPTAKLLFEDAPSGRPVPVRQVALLAVVLLLLLGRLPDDWADTTTGPGPVGVWVPAGGGGFPAFRYDGASVHLRISRPHAFEDVPQDGVARLRARWKDNGLYVLEPLCGRWQKLATYAGDHFVGRRDGNSHVMLKVPRSRLDEWERPLARARSVWHYPDLARRHLPLQITVRGPAGPGVGGPESVEPLRVLREDPDAVNRLGASPRSPWDWPSAPTADAWPPSASAGTPTASGSWAT
jgi:hypothetical protein